MSDQRKTKGMDDHSKHGSQDPFTIESDADAALHAQGKRTPEPKGVIAVDMDDVLCNTNGTIVESELALYDHLTPVHSELFPTSPPITIDEFEHYLYWHNRGWGTQEQTVDMVVGI